MCCYTLGNTLMGYDIDMEKCSIIKISSVSFLLGTAVELRIWNYDKSKYKDSYNSISVSGGKNLYFTMDDSTSPFTYAYYMREGKLFVFPSDRSIDLYRIKDLPNTIKVCRASEELDILNKQVSNSQFDHYYGDYEASALFHYNYISRSNPLTRILNNSPLSRIFDNRVYRLHYYVDHYGLCYIIVNEDDEQRKKAILILCDKPSVIALYGCHKIIYRI